MQSSLARPGAAAGQFRPAGPRVRQAARSRTVMFAEGPSGKPVREFREDTGEISVPGEKQQQQQGSGGSLYADQVAMAKKKDNLSREMKQRLRKEYYGLGGAENTAMNSNYFLWIIVVISVLAVLSKLTGAI